MKKLDLLTLGEVLLRLSPLSGERLSQGDLLKRQMGGAELNVAAGASLLGLSTGILSKLPDNDMGRFAQRAIRSYGVSDEYLVFDSEEDARLGIYFYENGAHPRKPGIVYDRKHTSMQKIGIDEFPESLYQSARCFHTSGITLALHPRCRDTAIEMMKRFKAQGALISFDVNFRGNLWSGPEARACIESCLPYVDIFFCSGSTAKLTFLRDGDTRRIMKGFTQDYPISVMASTQRTVHSPKVHSFGSILYSAKEDAFYEEEPYREIEVVDRIGSGDAYISGVLFGLLSEPGNYRRALEIGNASSAVKNTIPGDLPASDLSEIEGLIRDHQSTGPQSEMKR